MSFFDGCLKVEENKYIQNGNMLPLAFRKRNSNTVEEYGFDGCDSVFESAVIHPWKNVLHKSILLSDHVLLDTPYREGLISNWLICRYLHYTRF